MKELYKAKVRPLLHKFGSLWGAMLAAIDQFVFRGNLPFTLQVKTPDYKSLKATQSMLTNYLSKA